MSHIQNAIVVDFWQFEARQPNSGKRQCVKVQLMQAKDKKRHLAFIPNCGCKQFIKVHDIVTVQSIGGSLYGAKGDMSQLCYKVIKVNGVSLREKFLGKT